MSTVEEKLDRLGAKLDAILGRLEALEFHTHLKERPAVEPVYPTTFNLENEVMKGMLQNSEVSRRMSNAVGNKIVREIVHDHRR